MDLEEILLRLPPLSLAAEAYATTDSESRLERVES